MKTPNLLFITTDHQRADSLGMVQCGTEVTPFLNALAKESSSYHRAYTSCPLCVPARTAMATGRRPTKNGVTQNFDFDAPASDPAMHDLLAERGYDVIHVGMQHIRVYPDLRDRAEFRNYIIEGDHRKACEEAGIDLGAYGSKEGFRTEVTEPSAPPVLRPYSHVGTDVWPFEDGLFRDIFFRNRLLEALEKIPENHEKPVAVFLNLWAPHPPLFCPEPWTSRFPAKQITLPDAIGEPSEGEPSDRRRSAPAQLAEGVTTDQWRKAWSTHLGLVNLADELIGSVVDYFRKRSWWDNTMMIFTSDHGDHLGEHAMYQKMECYETSAHVPLLLRVPGLTPDAIKTPVSHLDILPTMIDMIGLQHPYPESLDGKSLVEENLGEGFKHRFGDQDRDVFIEYNGNWGPGDKRRCIVNQSFKLVLDDSGELEFFDLINDPYERKNAAHAPLHMKSIASMLDRLTKYFPEANQFSPGLNA